MTNTNLAIVILYQFITQILVAYFTHSMIISILGGLLANLIVSVILWEKED